MDTPFHIALPLLSLYPQDIKSVYYSKAGTSRLITAQFTITRLWNQPKCPSLDEWIKKLWYIDTMKYYSTIKKNKTMSFAGQGMSWGISC